jgi:hypothetical protein
MPANGPLRTTRNSSSYPNVVLARDGDQRVGVGSIVSVHVIDYLPSASQEGHTLAKCAIPFPNTPDEYDKRPKAIERIVGYSYNVLHWGPLF